MNFDLKKPCPDCPFRTDIEPFLRTDRVEEICEAITHHDKTFQCHKTIRYDGDGRAKPSNSDQHCAGALIMLERMKQPNQMMRIAHRLGMFDKSALHMDAPVYESADDMILRHRECNGD